MMDADVVGMVSIHPLAPVAWVHAPPATQHAVAAPATHVPLCVWDVEYTADAHA